MNKLFGLLFTITFLLSQSDLYVIAFVPLILTLMVLPFTTPETWGQKK